VCVCVCVCVCVSVCVCVCVWRSGLSQSTSSLGGLRMLFALKWQISVTHCHTLSYSHPLPWSTLCPCMPRLCVYVCVCMFDCGALGVCECLWDVRRAPSAAYELCNKLIQSQARWRTARPKESEKREPERESEASPDNIFIYPELILRKWSVSHVCQHTPPGSPWWCINFSITSAVGKP